MNRTTVVFLALAILLAHTLAIHQTPEGGFAAPYGSAHAAFRLGRNLVHEGRALWDPQGPWAESYPSPLLITVSAAAERVYAFPTIVAQGLGILCALGTMVIVAQFSPKRMAGLIAPLLLATSGAVAAAAASGTEAPLTMFLLTVTFLAVERRWRRTLLVGLGLLALARPEGAVMALAVGLLELVDRPRDASGVRRPALRGAFLPLIVLLLVLAFLRHQLTGSWLSPLALDTLALDPERWGLGLHYFLGFLYGSGSAPLLLLPVGFALAGQLTSTGRRALILFLTWCALVALAGGDRLPFWNALAPALPLGFVAVQSAITGWMDRWPRQAIGAWLILMLALSASLLASKLPGDVGPLPLDRILRAWMRPTPTLAKAYDRPLARRGLLREVREVERLRTVGLFLRDEISADASIATFWPGPIGYLSRKKVHDLLGRTDPASGEERPGSWRGATRVDLVRAMEERADYLVILIDGAGPGFLRDWLRHYDREGEDDQRLQELLQRMLRYELVSVPVPAQSDTPGVRSARPFLLLRNKDLGLAPRLELRREADFIEVLVHSEGHHQLVDLQVSVSDEDGGVWNLRPTGAWTRSEVDARTNVLVYDTGQRPIRMLRARLPEDVGAVELSALLHNPGLPPDTPLAAVGPPARIKLR